MIETVDAFFDELRAVGLPISVTEKTDALQALTVIDLSNRCVVRESLAATVIKKADHKEAFHTAFDIFFSSTKRNDFDAGEGLSTEVFEGEDSEEEPVRTEQTSGQETQHSLDDDELRSAVQHALTTGEESSLRYSARHAVRNYGDIVAGRPVGVNYYLFKTLRKLHLDELVAQVAEDSAAVDATDFEKRLHEEHVKKVAQEFKKAVEDEIRRRLVADRGSAAVAKTLRQTLTEDVDFIHASKEEMAAITDAIKPLARKIAVRLARKRRNKRRGTLDFRSTMRHSLSYGGVPAEVKYRQQRPAKPEIFVIADISGSVASFARFTLYLVHALASQFSNVRSFVFIDGLDEVTNYLAENEDFDQALALVNQQADVVWTDGHSNYGHALEVFDQKYSGEVTKKSTVLFLGDARNNYHETNVEALAQIGKKARKLFWLNPEPKPYWDTGDSIMEPYSQCCDQVFEVRNLQQLEKFVDNLA